MLKSASALSSIASLNEEDRAEFIADLGISDTWALLQELDEAYRNDPWLWFLSEVQTQDEATQTMLPWPDKDYLHDMVWVLNHEQAVWIPKSRRMMASWCMAAWSIFKARYFPHNAIFYQSETEEKSAFITDKRCCLIEDNLVTGQLKRKYKSIRTHQGLVGRITYEDTGSYIWAIPQGDDAIRSFTFSILCMDESEFQPEGAKALISALPILEKGAQLIVASTSNGPRGILAEVCKSVGFTKFI